MMNYSRSIATAIALLLTSLTLSLSACALPQIKAEDRLFQNIQLEFLGEQIIPQGTTFQNTPVGGLSGLTYSPKDDTFYAVSDDRSDKAPARFYQFKLILDPTSKPTGVEFLKVVTMQDEAGNPYQSGTIDPEGIAITPQGTVWVTSEGHAKRDIPPFIREFDATSGKLLRNLFYPDHYIPQTPKDPKTGKDLPRQGIQDNLGFESLTLSANAARLAPTEPYRLFTAIESDLEQDRLGEDAEPTTGSRPRLMHYYVEKNRVDLIGEYLYPLEPRPMASEKYGLSELLSLDGAGRFLALERSFGLSGFKIKIFQMVLAGAKDTSKLPIVKNLPNVIQPAQKELLLDLQTLDLTLDNLEGMTLGPRLPDGTQSLIIVSDDNFNKLQKTQILVFRIKGFKP
jgi:hypothetical protein